MGELADIFKSADNFYDLFGGSGTVAINALELGLYKSVYINEFKYEVFELYHLLAKETTQKELKEVVKVFKPTTKKGYLALREAYNQNKDPLFLLALHYHSFSNLINFNKSDEFNVPSGNRTISKERETLIRHSVPYFKQLVKSNKSFDEVEIKEKSFVYIDPPYFGTDAKYNKEWDMELEKRLHIFMDNLLDRGIPFVLSNTESNYPLIGWVNKRGLSVSYPNIKYSFRGYKTKTKEILVKGY
jgi:DNA adenine methylase Dam